jgi:hypothetical protein
MSPGKDEYNAFADQLQRYEGTLNRLNKLGLRIARSSRLYAYLRRLTQVTNDPNPFIPQALADQLTFDLREIDELIEIVEAVSDEPSPGELELLRLVQKGHESPDGTTTDKARDAQYELYLRAIFKKGGLEVAFREPDLVMTITGRKVHIAAKRPSSLSRLDDRLRDANGQVELHPAPGLVAISLDRIIRPRNGLLAVADMAALQPAVKDLVELFFYDNARSIARRVAGRRLAGVFFTTRLPGRTMATNHSVLGTSLHTEVLAAGGTADHATVITVANAVQRYLS